MDISDLLLETFGRIPPLAESAVVDLDADQLHQTPADGSNSIGWLIWHVARVQDLQISDILQLDQIWSDGEWASGFGLAAEPANSGYGHSAEEALAVRPSGPQILVEYLGVVDSRTTRLLDGLGSVDLDRIIDRQWDPPVSLGVRLVSIADDCLQHVGQANYLRGMFGW